MLNTLHSRAKLSSPHLQQAGMWLSLLLSEGDFGFLFLSQGKKVDGSANAYAINVSQKRKYRLAFSSTQDSLVLELGPG